MVEEYHDPLTDPDAAWRSEPATDAQKCKLRFYRRRFSDDLTKGKASNLIDDAMARHPEKEEKYQQWKKAEEDLTDWYFQATTSDFVGDDMGMPTRKMVQETITFLDATQPNWRQVTNGNAFSRFLMQRYPKLQSKRSIQAARIDNSTPKKALDDFLRLAKH